jgi:hypothetical protein
MIDETGSSVNEVPGKKILCSCVEFFDCCRSDSIERLELSPLGTRV